MVPDLIEEMFCSNKSGMKKVSFPYQGNKNYIYMYFNCLYNFQPFTSTSGM